MSLKRYKIFLASSAELESERKEIALAIYRLNIKWTKKNVFLELVVWEDLLLAFSGDRIQDYFNQQMLKCDMVLALFYKKVGKFTEEEFNTAYESFKKGNKPRKLYVFFKSGSVPIEEVDEEIFKISKLKKQIQELQQIYQVFHNTDDLILKLQHQLELIIGEQKENEKFETEADNAERVRIDQENYLAHIQDKFRYMDFTGLNAILQKPLELETIYVKLRAKESNLIEYRVGSKKKNKDFVSIFNQLFNKSVKEKKSLRMLILGKPGSGKTTLMKWIALQCKGIGQKDSFSSFIPVFLSLKDLGSNPKSTFRIHNIVNLVYMLYKKENIQVDSFLNDQMKENRLLFLLDGLDEIGDEKIRREVIDWIQKQYIFRNPLIVTSRFSGLNKAEGLAFRDEIPVFEIRDFELKDIDLFLNNWYRNIEIAVSGGQHMQNAINKGEKRYRELMEIIKDPGSKNLRELSVNPLLLTIIAIVHRTRAVLPRDRHKLYEECLKVMIELWNKSNRKIDICFSYDNNICQLSKLAKKMMEANTREMDEKEAEECLPEIIDGRTRKFFLKEMVVKAGLLSCSEGKIGFLHLTFQEYLTAWHFTYSENPLDILSYREHDYWQETFKLFVNIGNTQPFFSEIIDHLEEKEYWKNMNLWESCLKDVVVEDVKERIEKQFARKVFDILARIPYAEKFETEMMQLYAHYPIYKYAGEQVENGWKLFRDAPHPFVKSVGSSILFRAGGDVRNELITEIKKSINDFECINNPSNGQILEFLYRYNNSFVLFIGGTRRLGDFTFALAKVKSPNQFLVFSTSRYLIYLRYLRYLRYLLDLRGLVDLRDLRGLVDLVDLRDLRDLVDLRYLRDLVDLVDLHDLYDLHDFRDFHDLSYFRDLNYLSYLRDLCDHYMKNYDTNTREYVHELEACAYDSLAKLHTLSDKKLLKYFPNTTPGELKEFRESYTEIIPKENLTAPAKSKKKRENKKQ